MNKLPVLVMTAALVVIMTLWITDAMSQAKPGTTVTKKVQPQVAGAKTVTARLQNLDVETRIGLLEREVESLKAELSKESARVASVKHLYARHHHNVSEGAMWLPASNLWTGDNRNHMRGKLLMFTDHNNMDTSGPLMPE